MARYLDVYLHSDLVGQLTQDDHGQLGFVYLASWLQAPQAVPLSHSLPLREQPFRRNECRPFFAGILPEDQQREVIARNLGISARNDFAMLDRIGGECAGAVTLLQQGAALSTRDYTYQPLADQQLAEILAQLPSRPLLAGDDGVRLSLAGAQDKLAVHLADGRMSLPLNGAPSTHILKPAIDRFEGVVFNEASCMRLATAAGLPAATVSTHAMGDIDYLLVERYDRRVDQDGVIRRLHQEDLCQALGFVPETKYQGEGGPRLAQCFDLVRSASTTPVVDLTRLLDAVIFNVLVGNCDAHGKNFSLLYDGRSTRLAPLYDLVSTAAYPDLSTTMAMSIGGATQAAQLWPKHFDQLANEAGLGQAQVRKRVVDLAHSVANCVSVVQADTPGPGGLAQQVIARCETVQERFAAS